MKSEEIRELIKEKEQEIIEATREKMHLKDRLELAVIEEGLDRCPTVGDLDRVTASLWDDTDDSGLSITKKYQYTYLGSVEYYIMTVINRLTTCRHGPNASDLITFLELDKESIKRDMREMLGEELDEI
jgi:hypothetical protein